MAVEGACQRHVCSSSLARGAHVPPPASAFALRFPLPKSFQFFLPLFYHNHV